MVSNGMAGAAALTEASLDALANDWGADILRISLYVQEGGYDTDPAGFTAQVSRLIDEATERGMYALVDWHQLDPGDPNNNLAKAKTFFTAIANAHKNKNNIIYDVCNEPNGVTWARIKTYADQIIPVIRAIDAGRTHTGGYAWLGLLWCIGWSFGPGYCEQPAYLFQYHVYFPFLCRLAWTGIPG